MRTGSLLLTGICVLHRSPGGFQTQHSEGWQTYLHLSERTISRRVHCKPFYITVAKHPSESTLWKWDFLRHFSPRLADFEHVAFKPAARQRNGKKHRRGKSLTLGSSACPSNGQKERRKRGVSYFFQWIGHLSRKVETLRLLVAARGMVDYRVKSSAELKV